MLQLLSGNLSPDTGTVEIGDTVKIGYYTQECKNMDEHQRVIDYIKDGAEWIETINGKLSAAQMLETFYSAAICNGIISISFQEESVVVYIYCVY